MILVRVDVLDTCTVLLQPVTELAHGTRDAHLAFSRRSFRALNPSHTCDLALDVAHGEVLEGAATQLRHLVRGGVSRRAKHSGGGEPRLDDFGLQRFSDEPHRA